MSLSHWSIDRDFGQAVEAIRVESRGKFLTNEEKNTITINHLSHAT